VAVDDEFDNAAPAGLPVVAGADRLRVAHADRPR
jgi:hypothetical protein